MPARLLRSACRIACDSLVALGSAAADGATLFAKNSDRPQYECQPLIQLSARRHAPGALLRCTHIEIPQVTETARMIGSQPVWCWGFEHGLNEYGVAIGNHTVFSKDTLGNQGLIGMDLVRLGLERAHSAGEAVEAMTALIEAYGQGGSGYHDKVCPFHNSFLIADRATAYVLETSDRHWALRRVEDVGSISNHLTIGDDWEALSDGAIEHAITQGWWSDDRDERFSFAAAYRDSSVLPDVFSTGRHQRTCLLLEQGRGTISINSLKRALRDHYGRVAPPSVPPTDLTPADPRYFSVCMHAEPVGTTTASMIARLPPNASEPLICWVSLGAPCVGAFVPLDIAGDIPEILGRGAEQPSDDSPWWQFKRLLTLVEHDWERHAPTVRQAFDQFEAEITERMRAAAFASGPVVERTAFMHATVAELLALLRRMIGELSR